MIVILISTALREPFLSRFQTCASTWTWLKEQGYRVIQLVANPKNLEITLENDILTVPVHEEWQNMGMKLWFALKYLLQDTNIQGIFKFDDDVIIKDSTKALSVLQKLQEYEYASLDTGKMIKNSTNVYAQARVSNESVWKQVSVTDSLSFSYGSGSFLFVNRKSMEYLVESPLLYQHPIEDIVIGKILHLANVPLTVLSNSCFEWGHLDSSLGSSIQNA